MLARLRGATGAPAKPAEAEKKAEAATAVAPPPKPAAPPAPAATAAPAPPRPAAAPAAPRPAAPAAPAAARPAPAPAAPAAAPKPAAPAAKPAAKPPAACPVCKTGWNPGDSAEVFCMTCGYVWTPGAAVPGGAGGGAAPIKGRYHLAAMLKEFGGVSRFKATDSGGETKKEVVILKAAVGGGAADPGAGFDVTTASAWPSIAWEKALLEKAKCPALPEILEHFTEDGFEYLVEEVPVGQSLWNAWDDLDSTWEQRFGWLKNVAEGLDALHKAGAIIEGTRPDIITCQIGGQATLSDLSDLLPLPLPANPPIRGTRYTAPELESAKPTTDARADMYSFGAMLYALHLGRELTDNDFEKNGLPKHFIARFPDCHPLYGRLVLKTFLRDPAIRFPTDEAGKKDATGFTELINVLDCGRRNYGQVKMEIACWTTTGIVRTNNEDAFSLIHAAESRLDDFSEYAVVFLADGMGGYEAGELAAALCLDSCRKTVQSHPMFAATSGGAHPKQDALDVEAMKKFLYETIKTANTDVHTAPQKGIGRRGMGCTVEVVYIDGYNMVVGHVGDSRTYHLSQGKLTQVTRDQTLVNRLVELGQISEEEAENHPRKNELQQAIGGRRDVEPAVYSVKLKPGDWILVTTDGLTGHIKNDEIKEMFQSEAISADMAARRLVNFANLRGATDNSTVVVIRCP